MNINTNSNIVDFVEDIETILITARRVEENVTEIETTVKEAHSLKKDVEILTPVEEETVAIVEDDVKLITPLVGEVQTVTDTDTVKVPFFAALLQKLNSLICFKKC